MNYTEQDIIYEAARKRVKKLKGFYIHLIVYIVVNSMIIVANYRYNSDSRSVIENYSTAFFWGIGLFFHGLSLFSINMLFSKEWEERKIREIMERNRNDNELV